MAGPSQMSEPTGDAWTLSVACGVFVLGALLYFLAGAKLKAKDAAVASSTAGTRRNNASQGCAATSHMRDSSPNMHFTFLPSTGLFECNPLVPYTFDNENCSGLFLPMHRPTLDMASEADKYPYAAHFKGRKRLWEMRWQFRFKHAVTDRMRFGIELEEYVPVNSGTRRLMEIIVAVLRQTVGSEVYHSTGDDPNKVSGEIEKPVFTMPLFAFDQFIVTPEGEEPPELTDPGFADLGTKRTDDLAGFIRQISDMELKPGSVYTFAFWSISQFLDAIKWEIQKVIPFKTIDFNTLCGAPPVNLVLYTVDEKSQGDKRHVQRRKNYHFRLAFWSSEKPPSTDRLHELVPSLKDQNAEVRLLESDYKHGSAARSLSDIFACCVSKRI
eukprot:TRINITY_DN43060_c0_g1_i1.p1 TRINITY_DN43060_c0_g1~~TRINITY_DN43060_c0_g1_i1.p1  ORF type:complete len:384 (+),score=56.84 TRINITY_DN43060_c0_g1_i1:98-1249(+)